MSHADTIASVATDFEIVASTPDVKVAGYHVKGEKTFGIQFHPEVYHTTEGLELLRNFVVNICGGAQSWTFRQGSKQLILLGFQEVTLYDQVKNVN